MSQQLLEQPAPPAQEASPPPAAPTPAPAASATGAPAKRRPIVIPEDEPESFFQRWKVGIVLAVIVGLLAGAVITLKPSSSDSPPPRKKVAEEPMMKITPLPVPPPPPPPPPKVEPPKEEEKMIAEEKPEDAPPEPDPEPASDPAPAGYKADGPPDGFGARAGGGGGTGRGTLGARQPRSRWGWYAGQVQNTVAEALRRHGKLKSATLTVQAKIWSDTTGRITRAKLVSSTGDAALDTALANEVLTGLQLKEAPPADMPMPINLKLTARKP